MNGIWVYEALFMFGIIVTNSMYSGYLYNNKLVNNFCLQLMLKLTESLIPKFEAGLLDKTDTDILKDMTDTCSGMLQPLCATIGGLWHMKLSLL